MSRIVVLFYLLCLCTTVSAIDIEPINWWLEYDVDESTFDLQSDRVALADNLLIFAGGQNNQEYRIVNYRTRALYYRFEKKEVLSPLLDRQGKYLLFGQGTGKVVFDVQQKKESVGTTASARILYVSRGTQQVTIGRLRYYPTELRRIDLPSLRETRLEWGPLDEAPLFVSRLSLSDFERTAEELADGMYVLKMKSGIARFALDPDQTRVARYDFSAIPYQYAEPLQGSYVLALKDIYPFPRDDAAPRFWEPLIADWQGKAVKQFQSVRLTGDPGVSRRPSAVYLISPDKRTVIFFDRDFERKYETEEYSSTHGGLRRQPVIIAVYRIVYGDEVGRPCFSIASTQIKESPGTDSKTLAEVGVETAMTVVDRSQSRGNTIHLDSFWYKVELPSGVRGWILGKDIDIR